eukprot:GHRQ01031314.1.p1 GENE.GHRQ01031314.1~~GHRQ01031314.1.p1  ORF type:complete len:135 (+),score=32.21 GHRQ01031314.1:52-456(+)
MWCRSSYWQQLCHHHAVTVLVFAPAAQPWLAGCRTCCRKLFKLTKVFSAGAGGEARQLPLAVAEEGRAKVSAFQAYTPLVAAVCNPGLRERHWAAMAEIVGFEIKQDEVWSDAGCMLGARWPAHACCSRTSAHH